MPNPQPRNETNVIRMAADIAPLSVSDDSRTVEMQFYTGATVERYDYSTGEKYFLRLGLDKGQCDLSKLNGGPLLDSHMDYSVRNVLGSISNPRIENGVAMATAHFSDDSESAVTFAKVKNGTLRKVSVGAVLLHLSKESEADGVATYVADKWYPREVSIVPIPADPNAGFLSDQLQITQLMDQPAAEELRATAHEEKPMVEETMKPAGAEPHLDTAALAAAQSAGIALERERISGISSAVRAARLGESFAQDLINNGVNLNDARAKIIEELAKRADATPTDSHHNGRVSLESDARDKMRASLQNAIEYRAGVAGAKLNEGGREFAGMTLMEMGREVLTRTGTKFAGADRMELAAMALGMRVERFSNPGYNGTTDFPYVLANVMNKSLRAAYEAYPQTWKPIARGTTNTDFKTKYVNQLSESPTPVVVPPSGEFKYVSLSDKRESYALSTYGNIIALNRQAIINDDMSAFNRIPSLQGRACAQMESDIVWALITSNPTMGADSVALFNSAHGNYTSTGTAISQTSLGVMRALMRVQKGIKAVEFINVEPRIIAVPAALETKALQETSNQYTPQQGSNINTFRNLSVIVEPRLDAASTTAWYAFADPGQIDIIEFAYLAGQEGIYTEMRVGFDVDGVEMKVREDFGAQILDWRGCYKNVGA